MLSLKGITFKKKFTSFSSTSYWSSSEYINIKSSLNFFVAKENKNSITTIQHITANRLRHTGGPVHLHRVCYIYTKCHALNTPSPPPLVWRHLWMNAPLLTTTMLFKFKEEFFYTAFCSKYFSWYSFLNRQLERGSI